MWDSVLAGFGVRITAGSKSYVFQSPAQANLLMRYIRAIYRSHAGLAQINGLTVPTTPTDILAVKKQWERVERKSSSVPSDRMKDYWEALTTLEQEGKAAATVFKLLLLTGLRINEAQKLSWADVDRSNRSVTINLQRTSISRSCVH